MIKIVSLKYKYLFVIVFLGVFGGCNKSSFSYDIVPLLNPNGNTPLTAELSITSNKNCSASIRVLGTSIYEEKFDSLGKKLKIPVLGLYPNTTNKVEVTLSHKDGETIDTIAIKTEALPNYLPSITINKINRELMEPGWHLCDIHYAKNGVSVSRPMIFDDEGEIRWLLDLSSYNEIVWPIQRVKNGNLMFGSKMNIYEYDMLGNKKKTIPINTNYWLHHELIELPDGNLLLAVKKRDSYVIIDGERMLSNNDFIIVINPETYEVIKEWDVAKHLDVNRQDLNRKTKGNWIHINGLAYDESDKSIIVSGRNQGICKISWDDELKWILSPQKNWGKSGREGNGIDTNEFLLTAIDKDGKPFGKEVQEGNVSHGNFDFPWGQHAPEVLPNGNILLFDNGYLRNFNKEISYSRAVEYDIDEENMQVKQVWEYGKDKGSEYAALLISEADRLLKTNNRLITFGYVLPGKGKIIETTYPKGEEVFEATLNYKTLDGNKTFNWGQLDMLYRSERFKLEN
ncbi:aryl-sulfate sulfotransferase [Patiriisocius hiemis]|uniref:Aryl-sulfate sulfotransferase n=1 Tax=Patiriisocius hiemis TaxID=3075604 RepID=A0ABU2YBF2_9FLAO|nr:aryl-sulfate sulfotransferase [Constantimarinum sp. W242]MDT0555513.1 aryl-sulfate sulfotransferase [Constantimarinum sp. W242]